MKSAQAVFLTEDRKAVAEGDKRARFLLVREGHEIDPVKYKNIEGAADLIEGKKSKKEEEPKKTAAKH